MLEAAISHQSAIGILQRARGVVTLVVARGFNPQVPLVLGSLAEEAAAATAAAAETGESSRSPASSRSGSRRNSRSDSSGSEDRGDLAARDSVTSSPQPAQEEELEQQQAAVGIEFPSFEFEETVNSSAVNRTPSAVSDAVKAGGDMVSQRIL